jgi:hypothetical protein
LQIWQLSRLLRLRPQLLAGIKTVQNASAVFISLILAVTAIAQSPKTEPMPNAPPPKMSRDFRISGGRVVEAIKAMVLNCKISCNSVDEVKELDAVGDLMDKAYVRRRNETDKLAVVLLREFDQVTFDLVVSREASTLQPASRADNLTVCKAGACETMYLTCKKETEDAFEGGVLKSSSVCKHL